MTESREFPRERAAASATVKDKRSGGHIRGLRIAGKLSLIVGILGAIGYAFGQYVAHTYMTDSPPADIMVAVFMTVVWVLGGFVVYLSSHVLAGIAERT